MTSVNAKTAKLPWGDMEKYIPSLPSTLLGFDHFHTLFDRAADLVSSTNTAFPPVNVIRHNDDTYIIEVAVAGYARNELSAEIHDNTLTITGEKKGEDERRYLVKGIAGRTFKRSFLVADTVVVRDATLVDGILSITLVNVIPETKKPRVLEIK